MRRLVSENPNAATDLAGSARGQNLAAMTSRLPAHLWLGIVAGWLIRHQQAVIDCLRTENEQLKRQLNGRRPELTDDERRRLTVKVKALGRNTGDRRVHRHPRHDLGLAPLTGGP